MSKLPEERDCVGRAKLSQAIDGLADLHYPNPVNCRCASYRSAPSSISLCENFYRWMTGNNGRCGVLALLSLALEGSDYAILSFDSIQNKMGGLGGDVDVRKVSPDDPCIACPLSLDSGQAAAMISLARKIMNQNPEYATQMRVEKKVNDPMLAQAQSLVRLLVPSQDK